MDMLFVFNENCSEWYGDNMDYNISFAHAQMKRLADVVKNRHWLYLRELFDAFGADATHISAIMGWDGEGTVLEYSIDDPDENGVIKIHHNAKAIA